MRIRTFAQGVMLAALLAAPMGLSAQAYWTDWEDTPAPGTVTGTLTTPMGPFGVSYTGPYAFAQTAGGPYHWDFPIYDIDGPGTRPPTSDLVALSPAGTHTISFGAPVVDPFLAIMSLGRTSLPVSYTFTSPFAVVSEGLGWWGDGFHTTSADMKTLTGYEMHGVIQFTGTFTELSWTSDPTEYWHGVTVGVVGRAVPEPASYLLMLAGLFGLGFVALRRKEQMLA